MAKTETAVPTFRKSGETWGAPRQGENVWHQRLRQLEGQQDAMVGMIREFAEIESHE